MVGEQSELFLFAPEVLGKVEWGLRGYKMRKDLANYSDNIRYRVQVPRHAVMPDMPHLLAHEGRFLRRNLRQGGAVQPWQPATLATQSTRRFPASHRMTMGIVFCFLRQLHTFSHRLSPYSGDSSSGL